MNNSENLPLRGDFAPNGHFWVALTVLHVKATGQGLRFSTYRSIPSITGRANGVSTLNLLFVRLTVLAVEAPKVTQISLSEP